MHATIQFLPHVPLPSSLLPLLLFLPFHPNLCGHPLHIFWSAKDPPNTLLTIGIALKAFSPSSTLSTRVLKNSKASCCSLRLTCCPSSLRERERYEIQIYSTVPKIFPESFWNIKLHFALQKVSKY